MAILLNPRKRRKRAKARARKRAKNPRKKRKNPVGYVGKTARPKLVLVGKKDGKKVYKRSEKSKELFPDVIIQNPKRRRKVKRNPVLGNLTETLTKSAYGVMGIAGVNAITNLATKFVPQLDNQYVRSAVKLILGVAVPKLLEKQLGKTASETIQIVVASYVLFELIMSLLPENVKAVVSALETPEPRKVYYALPKYETPVSAVYPENSYVQNVQYELN